MLSPSYCTTGIKFGLQQARNGELCDFSDVVGIVIFVVLKIGLPSSCFRSRLTKARGCYANKEQSRQRQLRIFFSHDLVFMPRRLVLCTVIYYGRVRLWISDFPLKAPEKFISAQTERKSLVCEWQVAMHIRLLAKIFANMPRHPHAICRLITAANASTLFTAVLLSSYTLTVREKTTVFNKMLIGSIEENYSDK